MKEKSSSKPNILLVSIVILFIVAIVTAIGIASKVRNDYEGKTCSYNGSTYESGDSFRDNCNTCLCHNGEVQCTLLACGQEQPSQEEAPYVDGIRLPNEPTEGSACVYADQYFSEGDQFSAEDGCNSCVCSDGNVSCTAVACLDS